MSLCFSGQGEHCFRKRHRREKGYTCTSARATWTGVSVCFSSVMTQSILSMCSSSKLKRSRSMPSCVRSDWIAVAREKLGGGIAYCRGRA